MKKILLSLMVAILLTSCGGKAKDKDTKATTATGKIQAEDKAESEDKKEDATTLELKDKYSGLTFNIPKSRKASFIEEKSAKEGEIATVMYGDFYGTVTTYNPQPRGAGSVDIMRSFVKGNKDFKSTIIDFCKKPQLLTTNNCINRINPNGVKYLVLTTKYEGIEETGYQFQDYYFVETGNEKFPVASFWTKQYKKDKIYERKKETIKLQKIVNSIKSSTSISIEK